MITASLPIGGKQDPIQLHSSATDLDGSAAQRRARTPQIPLTNAGLVPPGAPSPEAAHSA